MLYCRHMLAVYFLIFSILAFPFIFPEEFTYWSQKIRRQIRENIKKRMTPKEWEKYKEDVPEF